MLIIHRLADNLFYKKGDNTMPSSINDYRQLIEQPWGTMFYDTLFRQLNLSEKHPLNILDFGADTAKLSAA